jgi:hypothetical protein
MENVLRVEYHGSNGGHVAINEQSGTAFTSEHWDEPGLGEGIYFRMYIRNEITDNATAGGGPNHPVQAAWGMCAFEWAWKFDNGIDGTYSLQFQTYQSDGLQWYLNDRLQKHHTYRFEWGFFNRSASGTYKLDLRIYDENETLIYGAADFDDQGSGGGGTLATLNPDITITDDCVRRMFVGNNGPGGDWENIGPGEYVYYGGVAVSREDWPGSYQPEDTSLEALWRGNEPEGFVMITDNPMSEDPYTNLHPGWGGPYDRAGWIVPVVPDVPPPSPASETVFQFVYPGPNPGTGAAGSYTRDSGPWPPGIVGKSIPLLDGSGNVVLTATVTSVDGSTIFFSGDATGAVRTQEHESGRDASRHWFMFPAGTREFYASISFRPDPDWHVLNAGSWMGTKLFHVWNDNEEGNNAGRFFAYHLAADGSETSVEGYLLPNQNITRAHDVLPAGEWAIIEMHYRLHDPGQTNGEYRWWVNGHLIGEYTDTPPFHPGDGDYITFTISGTWGGGVPDKTKDEWLQYGQIYISAPE